MTGNKLRVALHHRRPVTGREHVHHSDRGSAYTAWAFQTQLRHAGHLPGQRSGGDLLCNSEGRAHRPAALTLTCRRGASHLGFCRKVVPPEASARKPWLPHPRRSRNLPTVCPVLSRTIDCPVNGCKFSPAGVGRWHRGRPRRLRNARRHRSARGSSTRSGSSSGSSATWGHGTVLW